MSRESFLTVCLNPTLQKTLSYKRLRVDQVNRTATHSLDASGKGVNVARVLVQLGRDALHLTHAGGALAGLFSSLCARDGVPLATAPSGSEIRFCTTAIDEEALTVTELVEEAEPVEAGTEARVLSLFSERVGDFGTLVISGTKAAGYSDAVVPAMTRIAKERGLRVILDLRGADLLGSLPFGPDLIKPNLFELLSTYRPELASALVDGGDAESLGLEAQVRELSAELVERHGCAVVITRGASSVWFRDGARFDEVPIAAVPPVNTTGSGDAFTAGLAAALADGAAIREAVIEGGRCGALNAALLRPGVIL